MEGKKVIVTWEGGADDGRSGDHVSALSEGSGGTVWEDEQWQGAVSLSATCQVWPDICPHLGLSGLFAHGEAADRGEDAQREGDSRYYPGVARRVQ
jgi:hypothetical protein